MLSALFHASPNREGTVGGNPGRDRSKAGRARGDTHRWPELLEKKRPQSGKGRESPLIAPSLPHVGRIAAEVWEKSCREKAEKTTQNSPFCWVARREVHDRNQDE